MGLLTALMPQSLWLKVVLHGAIAVILVGVGFWAGKHWEVGTTAKVRADYADYRAEVERNRADANVKAAEEYAKEGNALYALQRKLNSAVERDRVLSADLVKELHNAPTSDLQPLGPAVLKYLDRVRREQAAPRSTDTATVPPKTGP